MNPNSSECKALFSIMPSQLEPVTHYHDWQLTSDDLCTIVFKVYAPFLQLYNIVVDTEETGKDLLQKGKLKKRYTIIPLNKIAAKSISSDVIKKAQSLVCPLCR